MKRLNNFFILLVLFLTADFFLSFYAMGAQDFEKAATLKLNQKWTGDFEQMVQNRVIRVLIPYSKTFYFLDKGTQRGAAYEIVKEFEKTINRQLKTHHLKVNIIFIPTSRKR